MDIGEFRSMITEYDTKGRANTNATMFHDQKETNLCSAFSGVTHFRDVTKIYFMDQFQIDIQNDIDDTKRVWGRKCFILYRYYTGKFLGAHNRNYARLSDISIESQMSYIFQKCN